ncbi:cleavage and polyadenylation specificity factor subunit 2 isoform X2 [Tanacetum coccineum]
MVSVHGVWFYGYIEVVFAAYALIVSLLDISMVEFSGGALRCGEYVTLRKVGDASHKGGAAAIQQIVIECPICKEYYKIQEYLYS